KLLKHTQPTLRWFYNRCGYDLGAGSEAPRVPVVKHRFKTTTLPSFSISSTNAGYTRRYAAAEWITVYSPLSYCQHNPVRGQPAVSVWSFPRWMNTRL